MALLWILIIWWSSGVLYAHALFVEREENRSTWRKTLEAEERSTAGTLSHETSHTRLGFSGERHNALTACRPIFFILGTFHL